MITVKSLATVVPFLMALVMVMFAWRFILLKRMSGEVIENVVPLHFKKIVVVVTLFPLANLTAIVATVMFHHVLHN